jgi:hypothetical protein
MTKLIIFFLFVFISSTLFSQDASDFNEDFVQSYNPGKLLDKGRKDLNLFNSLYTENESNWKGVDFSGFRNTFVSHLFQYTFGISKNGRLNLGFDATVRNNGVSSDSTYSGIGEAFQYKNSANSRFGLTSLGIRVRWQPLEKVKNFSLQSTLSGPTILNPEGFFDNQNPENNRSWADWNRITSWNQFFYTFDFNITQLFTEVDALVRFPVYSGQYLHMDLPVTIIYSYFPTNKWTIYGLAQHMQRFVDSDKHEDLGKSDFVIPASYTQLGFGLKYRVAKQVQIELLYNKFVRAINSGKGESINLGLRYLL